VQVSATCWATLPYWALGACLVRTITESHRPTEPAEPAPASDGNVIPNTSLGTWPPGRTPITVVPQKRMSAFAKPGSNSNATPRDGASSRMAAQRMIQIISVLTLSELQHGEDSSPPPRNGVGSATDASGGGDPVATLVRHAAAFFFVSQHEGDGCASGAPVPTPTDSAGQSAASCVSPMSRRGEAGRPPPRDGDGGATDASGGGDPVATLVRHAAAFFVSLRDGDKCSAGAPVPTPTVSAGQSAASCMSPLSRRGEAGSPPPRNGDGGATDVSGGGDPQGRRDPRPGRAAFLFVVPTPTVLARPPAPTVLGRQSTVSFTSPRKRDGSSVPEQDGDGCVLGLLNFRFLDPALFPGCSSPVTSS
jgi:hypothetical protein